MGNESSKQATVEPPEEWDPASNAKKFELVSPMSDLSDPSMFLHRRPHPKLSDATVQQIAGKKQRSAKEPPAKLPIGSQQRKGPAAARQTPAGDRRRRSKVITRDSAYKHESRERELPPPSAFYFPSVPTRESEENLNRLSVRKSSSTGARRKSDPNDDGKDIKGSQEQEDKENIDRKNTPLLKKAKRKVFRASTCLTGCFEESGHNIQLMKDNAKPQTKRGERLASEAGTEKVESLVKVNENAPLEQPFDPYKEDPLPQAKPTVLQFIDGTDKELTFNPVWRESHDGTYHSDPSSASESRRSSDFALSRRTSKEPSRRASDPPSQTCKSQPIKKDAPGMDDMDQKNQVPHAPGDRQELDTKETKQLETTSTKRESASSAGTSHESSYWNGFYKEAQVLHHEDAYFDRIAFVPNKASLPEPSPMANNSTATPAVTLFDKRKSLLGSMDASDVDCEVKLFPSATTESETGPSSKRSDRVSEGNSEGVGSSNDEPEESAAYRMPKSSLASSETSNPRSDRESMGSRDSDPASKDEQPLDGISGALVTGKNGETQENQASEQPGDQQENSEDGKQGTGSFLDKRISANQILVQTSIARRLPKQAAPKGDSVDIRAALQATPQSSLVGHRTSMGSAFSYRNRDVFTPVTSSTTYPKGSPFRPRVAVNEKAMAKAELDQPVVFTQSFDNRSRCSRDMEIQATESAPSMIESHDYRDIALGCFEDTPKATANKKENALALFSPGVMSLESPMSATGMSPAHPLLSNQVMNNAAFLFSPSLFSSSYASGSLLTAQASNTDQALVARDEQPKKPQDGAFSISTLGSRSRLSGRSRSSSKKPIRIPFSSSGSLPTNRSGSRKSSVSDDGSRQKSVRFSEAHSVAESESESGSQKSRRSVTWDFSFKAAPDNVDIPAIETKVSDLSDTIFGRDASPVGSSTQRESYESTKSAKSYLQGTAIEEETETVSLTTAGSVSLVSLKSESVSSQSLASSIVSQEPSRSSFSTTGTPEQATRTWTYCEFTKGVTPMLAKRAQAQATNSPVLRFKNAKNKWEKEKEVPVKRASSSFHKRTTGNGRVHLLASKFDKGGQPLEPMSLKSSSRDYGVLDRPTSMAASGAAPQERPMLRTPQIVGYTAKAYPNIYERARASIGSHSTSANYSQSQAFQMFPSRTMSTDASISAETKSIPEAPFDEIPEDSDDASQQSTESNDSTFVQSVATLRQDRHMLGSVNVIEQDDEEDHLDDVLDHILHADSTDSGEDCPGDEVVEDDFAELLLDNILGSSQEDDSTVGTAPQTHQTLKGVKSISWDDEENSTFTNILAAPTFSDESTTMSAMLDQQTTANLRHGAKTVKPHVQRLHHSHVVPESQALHLSPLQRTPMQASKWRQLAEQAQAKDTAKKSTQKKSIFRKTKKSGLSERNTNIA